MADSYQFLAMDFGAESGRGELVTLCGGKVTMEEVHRFPNRPVRLGDTLYWDFPSLFAETVHTLSLCAKRGAAPVSMAVDTWGVDFGLLDKRGALLGNPVHYRDARTANIHQYSDPVMPRSEIFAATGYEPWAISSLFQLLAMQRDGWPTLELADTMLNMPDLFNYFLTGVRASEMSIANTSNLMGTDGNWCRAIIDRFKLPGRMFCKMIPPATVLGELTADLQRQTGMGHLKVCVSCGHDTSAAVAAVGATGDNWAFLSCGTWSILGTMVASPLTSQRCLDNGFMNEYTIGGWYLARNISGLWLIQQLKAKWEKAGTVLDYATLTGEAAKESACAMFDAADASLMAPPDMEDAILRLCHRATGISPVDPCGQAVGRPYGREAGDAAGETFSLPRSRGQMIRCVLESLALEYSRRLEMLTELTGRAPAELYMVGGGIKNRLLCQLTADACGITVHAGADQGTAMGNALGQALAMGILKSPQEIRDVVAASVANVTYQPQDQEAWAAKRRQYAKITRACI